jgi:AraC-like DNA-binding protein
MEQVYSKSIQKQLKLKLIENKKRVLVNKIEVAIIELIYAEGTQEQPEVPKYLSEKLNYNYSYLANLFSIIKGTTLKTFIITTKVERAKELLIKDELSIAEIASMLHYKSVSHLSTQFKDIIGLTPSYFLASQFPETTQTEKPPMEVEKFTC